MENNNSYPSCQNTDILIDSIKNFLTNDRVKEIGFDYQEAKNIKPEDNMNVFEIVSDKYRREGFHGDVLQFFLTPSEKHKEGNVFLFAFIDFINENFKEKKIFIPKHEYLSVSVKAEKGLLKKEGRIDLFIESNNSNHCIIIENKMNNAKDTNRQLPKYYDAMKGEGLIVDAIIYLPLDKNKKPDQSTWIGDDKKHVENLLCIVPAYQESGISLVDGWIIPCSLKTKNIDCFFVLRQYAELVKQLSKDIMDNKVIEKFYQLLKDNGNIKTVQSVQELINDLPAYMAKRLLDHYTKNETPREYEVWHWNPAPNHFGVIFHSEDVWYKIDVYSFITGYSVRVFGQDKVTGARSIEWAKEMESPCGLSVNGYGEYQRDGFSFDDETKVIDYVDSLIACMKERLSRCGVLLTI